MSINLSMLSVNLGGTAEEGIVQRVGRWYSTIDLAEKKDQADRRSAEARLVLDPFGSIVSVCSNALADAAYENASKTVIYDRFTRRITLAFFPEGDNDYRRLGLLMNKTKTIEVWCVPLGKHISLFHAFELLARDAHGNIGDAKKYLSMITRFRLRSAPNVVIALPTPPQTSAETPSKSNTWYGYVRSVMGSATSKVGGLISSGWNRAKNGTLKVVHVNVLEFENSTKLKSGKFVAKAATKSTVRLFAQLVLRYNLMTKVAPSLLPLPESASLATTVATVQVLTSAQLIVPLIYKGDRSREELLGAISQQAIKIFTTYALVAVFDDYLPEMNPLTMALLFFQFCAYYEMMLSWSEEREAVQKSPDHVSNLANFINFKTVVNSCGDENPESTPLSRNDVVDGGDEAEAAIADTVVPTSPLVVGEPPLEELKTPLKIEPQAYLPSPKYNGLRRRHPHFSPPSN